MRFEKTRLCAAEQGYSIQVMRLLAEERIVAAPEKNGPVMVFTPDEYKPIVLAEEPGGCMGFAPFPGRDDAVVLITKFYPIFKAEEAGLHVYTAERGLETPWKGRRVLDLPFVHRIATVTGESSSYLVAATVCGGKDYQDDWSRPGTVYAAVFPNNPEDEWETEIIHEGIHRNHGMGVAAKNGGDRVFVSGDEGVFGFDTPPGDSNRWSAEKIIETPVSEMYFADLDRDGEDELAVIEPFHGNRLVIYKKKDGNWEEVFEAGLSFGHGLWAGTLGEERVVIVGNRADTKDLVCYRTTGDAPFAMEATIVDGGSGTTNLDVIKTPRGESIVTSNAEHAEYAIYRVLS